MANWGNTQISQENVKIIEHERVAETDPEVYKMRGDEFASQGLLDKAEQEYLTAIRLRDNAGAKTRDEAYSYYRYHRDLYKMYYKSGRKDFEEKADSTFYKAYYWDARKYRQYAKTLLEVGSFKDIKNMWNETKADLDEGMPITMLLGGLVIYLFVLMIVFSETSNGYVYSMGLIPVIPLAIISSPRNVFKAEARNKGSHFAIGLIFLLYIGWFFLTYIVMEIL